MDFDYTTTQHPQSWKQIWLIRDEAIGYAVNFEVRLRCNQ